MSPTATKEKAPKAAKAPKEPKEKVPAIEYTTLPQARPLLDEEQRLKAVPTDFDFENHAPLKKGDFVLEAHYMQWKASALDFRAASLTARAASLRTEAANLEKFGDPALRSKARKAAKLQERLAELMAELKQAGVTPPTVS